MIIDSPIISGSSAASGSLNQFGNVTITGSLTVTGAITGAVTGSVDSASYASNAELLDGRDSTTFTSTSSFQNYTSSNDAQVLQLNNVSASFNSYTSSNNANIAALNAATASLYNATSSIYLATASIYLATASIYGATSSLFAYTASNSANVANLFATSASLNAAVADIRNATASLYGATGSLFAYTSSNNASVAQIQNATASLYAATSSLYNATASIYGATSSLFNYSASSNLRIGSLEQYTASLNTRSASFACVTATNNFACTQYFSNASNAVSFTSTGSLYSDGGVRFTKDMYVSGTAFFNNVTVFGTQSVAYISSSQLNIGTNIISVNTDTPSVRFGGLAVYDSGSTGLTGSILWDSEQNHWVYTNPSGSTYSGGMFISGPRASSLGTEQGTTACRLLVGQGGDHLTSSMIYHSSTVTCIPTAIVGESTACFASTITAGGDLSLNPSGNSTITQNASTGNYNQILFKVNGTTQSSILALSSALYFSVNGSCTALTISNTGAATFSNALQVAGQQAAANYGGTGLNFDFTSGNVGRIASVKTTSGGSSLELHTYNTSGNDVTALTISNTGAATFSSTVDGTIFNSTSNAFRFSGNNAISLVSLCSQNVVKINAAGYWGTQLVGANDQGILINNSGNVYINAVSDVSGVAKFLIQYGSDSNWGLVINNTFTATSNQGYFQRFYNNGYEIGGFNAANNCTDLFNIAGRNGLRFSIGSPLGTEAMRITSGGAIGIGTTSPSDFGAGYVNLSLGCNGKIGYFNVTNGTINVEINADGGGNVRTRSNHDLVFGTNETARARITAAGITCFACQVCAPRITLNNCSTAAVLSIGNPDSTNDAGVRGLSIITDRLRFGVSPITSTYGAIATNGTNSGITFVTYDTAWCERVRIECTGVTTFACQICTPSVISCLNVNSGHTALKICNPNPGSSAFSQISIFNNTADQAGLFYNSSTRSSDGGVCSFSMYNDSATGNIRIRTGNNIVLATGTPATDRLTINSSGIACFSNIACAAGFSTSGFLRVHNTMRTFAISKNFGERQTNADYFRISTGASNGYQVMVYSVSQNGGVGWNQSQLFHASTAPYWGGWIGTSGAVSTLGSGSGYISSVVIGTDGTITFRVTTGDNGTNTTGTILSYIQVTAFNIDYIDITAL
jgi:hypothetical protein